MSGAVAGQGESGGSACGAGTGESGGSGAGAGAVGPERDPGLQPERTRLAWRRTTLSCTVVAVLAVKQAVHGQGDPGGVLAAALSVLVWLGFLVVTHRRLRELDRARPPVLSARRALAAVGCVLALTVLGVALMP
ncbi:DUF202 domain-containing protein [Streptomyces sp. NPDC004111]|uniref:DUF202 domain-containing protein n=1 Tax=Streptomyces sp. NPDC004111 TaxID=3364690 RepID=UPI0036BEA901